MLSKSAGGTVRRARLVKESTDATATRVVLGDFLFGELADVLVGPIGEVPAQTVDAALPTAYHGVLHTSALLR
jgi:hypothetical protein